MRCSGQLRRIFKTTSAVKQFGPTLGHPFSGLLAARILTWTESQASHPSTRAFQCGPLRFLQRGLSGFHEGFMAWVCLFPNARSTHRRHTGPDHGLHRFLFVLPASRQAPMPNPQRQPRTASTLSSATPSMELPKGTWVPLREVTRCSTSSHSAVGYHKQISHSATQHKPTARVRASGRKSCISAHICTLTSRGASGNDLGQGAPSRKLFQRTPISRAPHGDHVCSGNVGNTVLV